MSVVGSIDTVVTKQATGVCSTLRYRLCRVLVMDRIIDVEESGGMTELQRFEVLIAWRLLFRSIVYGASGASEEVLDGTGAVTNAQTKFRTWSENLPGAI